MNKDMTPARVIEIRDMLYRTAQKWRRIILGALIIALLAAAIQVVSGLRTLLDEDKLADETNKYQIKLYDYMATGEQLKTRISDLRDQSENQQEYNEKSVLMKIDPTNKWVGSFQFYIDSKYQIDPGLSYQNTDRTSRLLAAYYNYLYSGEMFGLILENTEDLDEIRFLTEIYNVSIDQNAATLTVSVVGATEATVNGLLDFVKSKVEERYPYILETVGDHSYEVMIESVYSVVDLSLDERQKANLMAVSTYANAIGETNEALETWEKQPKPKPEYGAGYTARQAVKYLIIGGVIGLLLMVVWYMVKYIFSGTVKTDWDWRSQQIPVLGHIRPDVKNKHFLGIDNWLDRLFDHSPGGNGDRECNLAAHNLESVLKANAVTEAAFIGSLRNGREEELARKMAEASDCGFRFAGDILRDAEAVKRLEGTDAVVLLAENQETRLEDVRRTLTLLRAWNKTLLGVVVVE